MISQQHFENFFCCFDHCCSLLSQGQPGAVIWTRCKCMERNDELKAYTTGGSPSWEDSSSTKGGRMACKCALLNKGVPPDQMLSTWQEALQSSPGPLPDVLKPCLQLPAWSSPWFLPRKKGCLYTDVGIWKSARQIVFYCTWILSRLGVKTSGSGLFLTYMESHHCKKNLRSCISTKMDTCAAEEKRPCLAVHWAQLEEKMYFHTTEKAIPNEGSEWVLNKGH